MNQLAANRIRIPALAHIIVQVDGCSRSNPGASAIGAIFQDADGTVLKEIAKPIGVATNNEAEYRAVILALELAAEFTSHKVEIRTDSQLVANQLNKRWRCVQPNLQALGDRCRQLALRYENVEFVWVTRSNKLAMSADRLANSALD